MNNNLLGYKVYSSKLENIQFNTKQLINTINQYSYIISEEDKKFKEALTGSDILLPDGIGIVVAVRVIYNLKVHKIAGADLHKHLLEKLNNDGGSCFYLGSSESTLIKIRERITKEYPAVKCAFYSPPFKSELDDFDTTQMIEAVNVFKPDVLFVGMTAPKQEKWAHDNKCRLNTQTICCIGAVFDFYAGTVKRPNIMLIKLGLEWLGRLIKEPQRMWRRYVYYGPIFIYYVLKEKAKRLAKNKVIFMR